jgi:hypothetical protein
VIVPPDSPFSWSVPFDKFTYMADGTPSDLPGLTTSIVLDHFPCLREHPYLILRFCRHGHTAPHTHGRKIYSCVKASHLISDTVWSIPCDSKFPITLTFGGRSFKIDERDTVKKLADGTCHGVVSGGADKVAAVGVPFMRNFYTYVVVCLPRVDKVIFFSDNLV